MVDSKLPEWEQEFFDKLEDDDTEHERGSKEP